MKGERKIPTRILTPRLNQLEPTFFRTSIRRVFNAPSIAKIVLQDNPRDLWCGSEAARPLPKTGQGVGEMPPSWLSCRLGNADREEFVPQSCHQIAPCGLDLMHARFRERGLPASRFRHAYEGDVFAPIFR